MIVFNDEEHTFEYVIETLMKVFGYPLEKSYSLTLQIHTEGKGIVLVGRPRGGGTQAGPDPLRRPGFLRDEEGGLSPDGDRRAAAGLTADGSFVRGGARDGGRGPLGQGLAFLAQTALILMVPSCAQTTCLAP